MTRAIDIGLAACETCELVVRTGGKAGLCPRCGEPVHARKRGARMRSWAFLSAAAILYVPANTLVMMRSDSFSSHREDTVLTGIAFLWGEGSWGLAALVFVASVVIPMVKLASLGFLLVTAREHSTKSRHGRTLLYRVLEIAGHWSMLDVFVVALLAAVVQMGPFAKVDPGPAVLPFAGVVILTMLASSSFDPRAIWDRGAA